MPEDVSSSLAGENKFLLLSAASGCDDNFSYISHDDSKMGGISLVTVITT